MPRMKRCQIAGIPQLVFQRGHNGEAIFTRDADYRTYLEGLHESASNMDCRLHAYAVLRDSFYLLCTPGRDDGLSRLMQAVAAKYAYYFNNEHHRTGSLWDGRYKSCLVEPGEPTLVCYLYVEERCVDASCAVERSWSSYPYHALGRINPLIEDHAAYRELSATASGRQEAYRKRSRAGLEPAKRAEIERALRHGLVLGCDAFKDRLAGLGHARVRMGKPGRPRKMRSQAGALRSLPGMRHAVTSAGNVAAR